MQILHRLSSSERINSSLYCILRPAIRLLAPRTVRARVVIYDFNGRVLLIRNRFGSRRWTLPGGGIKRSESPKQAAIREVREELGLNLSTLATGIDLLSGQPRLIDLEGASKMRLIFVRACLKEGFSDHQIQPNFEIFQWRWAAAEEASKMPGLKELEIWK